MPLTKEQIDLLDQILEKGFASKVVKILGGKVVVTLDSLQATNQLEVEALMKNMESMSQAEAIHKFSVKLLSQSIKIYHVIGKDPEIFKTPEMAEKFLVKLPVVILDTLIGAQSIFERDLLDLAKSENLETNFTPTPSEEQKPS